MRWSVILPALAAMVLLAACGGGGSASTGKAGATQQSRAQITAQAATGPTEAAGVRVAAPSVDLGRVPLDTPIPHAWVLNNTGMEAVTLGQPRIQTLEGC